MANDPILHLLGLARKAARLELGEEPVGAVCRARQAKLVLIAADAAPNTFRRAAHFGEAGNVLWLSLPQTKEELGFALGRSSVAMLALTDIGFASSLVKKLAAADPEKYGAAAAALEVKANKALQRQKEQRQHEKNLKQGKHKPWAPPPKAEETPKSTKTPVAKKPGPSGRKLTGSFKPKSKS
ncbi:MAG: 50S ribosomal protein L7 [Ruminococcaceae bacterium]|nr:50S ribosomal protein L7 [Oscillospiraceae bacterium]